MENYTETHSTSEIFTRLTTLSTQHSEPQQGGPQEGVTKPFEEPQPVARVPIRPRPEESDSDNDLRVPVIYPQPMLRVPVQPRFKELHDDLAPKVYSHLGQRFEPPPSQIPPKKRRGFIKYFTFKVRGFFGLKR